MELHDISFNETITRACTDQYDNLWLTGTNHIYLVKLTDDQYQIEHTFPFQNQLFDIPMISLINNRLYFIYSMGYLFYDGDTLREDHVFREVIGLPTRSIQSPDGLVWVFNGRVWNRIDRNGKIEQFEYLSLFPDMNFISYDEAHDVFDLLTASNKIYFYDHFRGKKMQPENDLILRRITTNNGLISDHNKIIFTYEDNSLSFKFSEPDYLGLLKVEYQYKLQEQMKVWSEWSPENSVNLNYLQPGKYYLNVRARDTFGRIKEAGVIEFKVNPPYWKQPWFYAAEILVMAVMLIGVKRLRALNIRYPFIVDGLGIFTLIIILALIQSTLQNYFVIKSTPVTDFAMNVVVAILAFPIEQRLRKFLS